MIMIPKKINDMTIPEMVSLLKQLEDDGYIEVNDSWNNLDENENLN